MTTASGGPMPSDDDSPTGPASHAARGGPSKTQQVYTQLRAQIISGRYSPGYRLVIDQVARELGVSPVPVREAIRRLQAEKLVNYTRNVGAQVASLDPRDYVEVMETLAVVEGVATALSAPHLGEGTIERARAVNERMRAMASQAEAFDPLHFTHLNFEFHDLVCSSCPNKHLLGLLGEQRDRVILVRRNVFPFESVRSITSVDEHSRILDLIEAGAPAAQVEDAARRHKLRSMRQFVASHFPDGVQAKSSAPVPA